MTKSKQFLVVCAFLVGCPPAWAGHPVTAAATPTAADDDAPEIRGAVSETTDVARWPRRAKDRNLTLPAGLALAGPDVNAYKDGTGATTVTGSVAIGLGITDGVELNTLTPTGTMRLTDFSAAGPWDAGIGVEVVRGALGGRLEVIARGVAGYDFEARAARPVRLGVQVQYSLGARFALVSHDTGVTPGITIGTGADMSVSFGLPVGLGVQATERVWIEADTNLISSIGVRGAPRSTIADVAPVLGTLVWNVADGALDVLAYAGCNDAYHAADTAYVGAGARYYLGKR